MREGFAIMIPSWNNLAFLRLCVESIRRNSRYDHQIIVHVNEGADGTLEWVRSQGLDHTYSESNVGVCLAMNMMRTKVERDYIYFLNDDMYVLPGWDEALMREIVSLPDNRFFLSSTTIQPRTPMSSGIVADFGDTVESFREKELLERYMEFPLKDWSGSTIPPNLLHRDVWDLVGGYSVEYTPGMYSDPDLTAKLWFVGIRYMKGLSGSRVYHFETKSTARVRKNDGSLQFLLKWGMTSSTFRKQLTRKGRDFNGSLTGAPLDVRKFRIHLLRGRIKGVVALLHKHFGPLKRL